MRKPFISLLSYKQYIILNYPLCSSTFKLLTNHGWPDVSFYSLSLFFMIQSWSFSEDMKLVKHSLVTIAIEKKNSEISKCRSKIKNVPLYKLTKSIFQIIKQKCLDFNKCITINKFEAMYADYNKIIIGNFNDFL